MPWTWVVVDLALYWYQGCWSRFGAMARQLDGVDGQILTIRVSFETDVTARNRSHWLQTAFERSSSCFVSVVSDVESTGVAVELSRIAVLTVGTWGEIL